MNRTNSLFLAASALALVALVSWSPSFAVRPNGGPVMAPAAPATDHAAPPVEARSRADAATAAIAPAPAAITKAAARRVVRRTPAPAAADAPATAVVPEAAPAAVAMPAAPPYQQRVADATALGGADSDRALHTLRQIAADEPDRPEAYEAMAVIRLRHRDYRPAAELFGAALRRGGKATFTLIHDHSRGSFDKTDPKATCVGELIIDGNAVRFEAPDHRDRFAAGWTEVRDAGANKFFGSGIGGFHIAVTTGGEYRNFNLAPASRDKAEAQLILDLLTAHARRPARGQ
jgi:hypothetical protein